MGYFAPQLYEVMDMEHDTGDGLRIGLDDYPIFNENHRPVLNQLIIDEYLNREIGLESVPLFIHRLRLKMRQMMPYYNKLYLSELIEFDPLATFDLTTARDDNATGTAGSTANGTTGITSSTSARAVNSDTPENQLSEDEDYATALTDTNSQSASNTTSGQNTTSQNTQNANGTTTVKGFQGAAADQLAKYRSILLNIDMMILPQLNELFMLVLSTGSEILPSPRELHALHTNHLLPHIGRY
jgi:hypothetical protein